MGEFVEVYIASDITFAYLVKAQPEDAGIPVRIANENLSGAYCLAGMGLTDEQIDSVVGLGRRLASRPDGGGGRGPR